MASGEVVLGYAALSCWECAVFGGFFGCCLGFFVVFCLFGWGVFCDLFPKGFYGAPQYISLSCVSIVWERFYSQ